MMLIIVHRTLLTLSLGDLAWHCILLCCNIKCGCFY